jgi:hypothetical protein
MAMIEVDSLAWSKAGGAAVFVDTESVLRQEMNTRKQKSKLMVDLFTFAVKE